MTLANKSKKDIISDFSKDGKNTGGKNTGSTEVQCALMTKKIEDLTNHLKTHKKDFSSRRSLLILVGKRRRLLDYLKSNSSSSYDDLIKKLNIRK